MLVTNFLSKLNSLREIRGMKAIELRKKSRGELLKELARQRDKLQKLHFKLASAELKNTSEIKAVKKNIARILTILNEKNA